MPYLLISLNNLRPSVNFRKLIFVGIELSRFIKREQERQLNMFFLYFYVLCHHHFINFTLQRYTIFSNHSFVQLLDGEYQVPVATPNDIAAVEGERAELLGVKVFVILRMQMPADIVSHVHRAVGAVAENQPHLQPAKVNSFCYV